MVVNISDRFTQVRIMHSRVYVPIDRMSSPTYWGIVNSFGQGTEVMPESLEGKRWLGELNWWWGERVSVHED